MNIHTYIKEQIAKGVSREKIYLHLLKSGDSVEVINRAWQESSKMSLFTAQELVIRAVAVFGSVFIGLGVISLIASNWQGMLPWMKITWIIAGIILAYAGSIIAKTRNMLIISEALILLANLIYGAGIFLVGQIYHLELAWLNGFLLWSLGVGASAWILRNKVLYWLFGAILILVLVVSEPYLARTIKSSTQFRLTLFLIPGVLIWSFDIVKRLTKEYID